MAENLPQNRFGFVGDVFRRPSGWVDSHGTRCRAYSGPAAMVRTCNMRSQDVTN
jgi:hypothetical protein